MINNVVLTGRLTKMPDIRTAGNDKKVATMTIACERSYKNQKGEKDTDFIPVILWRSIDFVEKYIGKGDLVCIRGMIQTRSYEKDGVKHFVTEVLADEIQLCNKAGRKEDPKELEGFVEIKEGSYDDIAEINLPF